MNNMVRVSLATVALVLVAACGVEGPPGPVGPEGPQGPNGSVGPTGRPGASLAFVVECGKTVGYPVGGTVTLAHRIFIMEDESRLVTCEVADAYGTYASVRWFRPEDSEYARALCEVRTDAERDATGGRWVFDHAAIVGVGTTATYEDSQGSNRGFSTNLGCSTN